MKSFINSLPSHRKKKARLKKKYHSRQTTLPFATSDKRIASSDDDAVERSDALGVIPSLDLDPPGCFTTTRPFPPPPARVSLENEFHRRDEEASVAGGDCCESESLGTALPAEARANQTGSYQETRLEHTHIQQALANNLLADAERTHDIDNVDFHPEVVQKYGAKRSAPSDALPSPVHSSSAIEADDRRNPSIDETEMVGILGSRRRYDNYDNVELQEMEVPNIGLTHELQKLESNIESNIATNDEPCNYLDNADTDRDDRHSIECHMERHVSRNHSIDTDPVTNVHDQMGEPRIASCSACNTSEPVADEKSLDRRILPVDKPTEFALTTSDITGCVEAMDVARKILEADPCDDPFDGIDIDLWKSIFEDFEKYVAAFDDPTSATDANELQNINDNEKAFAIFDRGMKVNHCNVVFISDMIRTISKGIDSHYRSDLTVNYPGCTSKLDHLAECIDMLFGVHNKSATPATSVSVGISKLAGDSTTVLKFCLSFESSDEDDETTSALPTIQNPSSTGLPPHLQAMSQVFAQFASETARPLHWQVGSTRETLAATREGAKDLQRQALVLQDELQDAQGKAEEAELRREQAETEFARQMCEFQHRVDSFEREKERYQLELASLKEQYERERTKMKAELTRVKSEIKKRPEGNQYAKLQSSHKGTPPPKPIECALENGADEEPISQSIPRNIEFLATATVDSDMEGSKGTNYHPKNVSKTAPPGWFGPMQTMSPLRNRSPAAPAILNDERVYRGYGKMGSSNQRNTLPSIAENRSDYASAGLCQLVKSDSRPEKADRSEQVGSKQNVSSPEKCNVSNPILKQPKPPKNILKETDNNSEPSFAYQEVVRGTKRQALPGHECDECRKFLDALGTGFNRDDIFMKCSRHRARYAPQSTPPDFWRLTFADSVASKKSNDNNDDNSIFSSM